MKIKIEIEMVKLIIKINFIENLLMLLKFIKYDEIDNY